MKRRLLLLSVTFLLLTGFTHIPQGANETVLNEALQGQRLIFEGKYGDAQKLFNQLWRKYPNSPLGTFGLMALYNAIMFENYDFSLDKSFAQVSYANEQIVDKIAKNPQSSAWDNFLCGASAGLRGFYYIRLDKPLKAMGQARTADKCIERALKKDPQFKDPLLGKGMSLYWRSVFTQSFSNILPFFKDRRPEGLKLMQQAIAEGMIANELARVSLMFAYLNDRKNRQGQRLAQELLTNYPDNTIAKLHLGRFNLNLGKNKEALVLFDEVLTKNPEITVALYFKGRVFYRMGKRAEAKALFEEFIEKHKNPAWIAYAHYQLGHLALAQKDRKKAFYHFKKGHRTYGAFKPNLKMVLKLRNQ
ncbi:MAG: tetratricopeptide repeat protein [bacterium]|nr:tetratricopeptide repeat protein [bacterium]